MPTTTKRADISAASMDTRTSFVKSAQAMSLFFNLCICVRSIGRLFTPKPRTRRLILNSRCVFKNQLYFIGKQSNFVAFLVVGTRRVETTVAVGQNYVTHSDVNKSMMSTAYGWPFVAKFNSVYLYATIYIGSTSTQDIFIQRLYLFNVNTGYFCAR